MRVESKWTPGGIVLWLIAAIVASLIVCSQSRPATEPSPAAPTGEFDLDVDIVE